MSVELHLPDLPEVPLSLGAEAAPRVQRRQPWLWRLRDVLSSYLPLLLMGLLALGTWWLVRHTPARPVVSAAPQVRHEPDYEMSQFAIERFDKTGRLRVRVEGAHLRHFPDTDRYEIEQAHIRGVSPDGEVTWASADRALANGDVSEVQLIGQAHVSRNATAGSVLQMRSEFLHLFLVTEQVRTHLPVQVNERGNDIQAASLAYDHGRRLLELGGKVRATLVPAGKEKR